MGIDTASYNLPSTREGIRDFIRALKAAGYRFAIIGTQDNRCRTFLEVAQEEAFDASAYKYLYIRNPLAPQVEAALDLCGGLAPMLWLDVEDSSYLVPWATWVAELERAVLTCQEAGILAGIYTRAGAWRQLTGNSQAFAGLPLWDALYSLDGEPNQDVFNPYGGFPGYAIRQYHNTTDIGLGVSVDINLRWRS